MAGGTDNVLEKTIRPTCRVLTVYGGYERRDSGLQILT